MRLIICIIPVLAAALMTSSCTSGETPPNEVQLQHARIACEQVGLKPGTSEVSECAANLQAALSNSSGL